MSIKQLVPSTHPILNHPTSPVTQFDHQLETLLTDLEDTLYAEEATAICAPQMGIDQQVAIIDMGPDGLLQLINPYIISHSDETATELEGSISLEGVYGTVTRSRMIVVQAQDRHGREVELTAYDDIARMILHMYDHFQGVWFTHKMEQRISEDELEAYLDDE
ncbi:peptide deformylase [Staphylococcus argensis]|uniref:Peptide deformylase-like n=1 Tax=Staphylococcus argensis TaxID=1607738 RepID=A0A2K4FEQ1_9STAP|nr:peptide deformylase [Staphylococcus argensis]MCY6990269.1 peptide deformylase [Staphylococcus argensis]POA09787.1 peptide deformylase [Staphylococcus argensis]